METSSIRVVIPSPVEEPALSPPKGDPYPAEPFSPAQPAQQALGTTSFWAAQAFTECVSTQIGIVIPTRGADFPPKHFLYPPHLFFPTLPPSHVFKHTFGYPPPPTSKRPHTAKTPTSHHT